MFLYIILCVLLVIAIRLIKLFYKNIQTFLLQKSGYTWLNKPEDCQVILTSQNCLEKPYFYRFALNESGLVTAKQSLWKVHRKLINPSFNNKILQSFMPIFNEKVQILMENLEKKITKGPFDVFNQFSELTLDLTCATSFGWNSGVQQGKHAEYFKAIYIMAELALKRVSNIFLHFDFIYKITSLYREQKKHCQTAFDMTNRVIHIKRDEYDRENKTMIDENNNEIEAKTDEDVIVSKPQIFINQLFKLRDANQINDKHLHEHIDTMIGAGTDTTATGLSNVILLLAIHPEIQDKVIEELEQVFPDKYSDVEYEDLRQLNYLDMVIKESLRLMPTIPAIARKATADIQLKDRVVKKGSTIGVYIYSVHTNPDIWGPDADKFNPDNFLPDNVATRHPYSFIPFSAGPRNCIGYRYATIVLKVALAKVLRQYRFKTNLKLNEFTYEMGVTAKLNQKHMITIERR